MSTISTIIKNLILPIVIKSAKFDVASAPDVFWEQFASDFVTYEIDASSTYSTLYKLDLDDPEYVFKQLPSIFLCFIKAIAEDYVLGNQSEITAKLLENKNETFLKEIVFLNTMKAVIIKTERNQLKEDLPYAYDRLAFELDEDTLRQVAKKKSREDLRAKFEQWDEEIVEQEIDLEPAKYLLEKSSISLNKGEPKYNSKNKAFSLSWIKYVVAACVVLLAGVLYFKFSNGHKNNLTKPKENIIVISDDKKNIKKNKNIIIHGDKYVKSEYFISAKFKYIQSSNSYDYVNPKGNKSIVIYFEDVDSELKYLDKEINKTIENSEKEGFTVEIGSELQEKLDLLLYQKGKYEFDNETLMIYFKETKDEYSILSLDNKRLYLKCIDNYYLLQYTKKPLELNKVTDSRIIEQLQKIIDEQY